MIRQVDEQTPLTLTVDALYDYRVCELFYDYRHNNKAHESILSRDLMSQRFENTLKKVASFFFYRRQAGSTPSYSALLNRWEKLWFPKDMTAYDLAVEQHESAHGNLASYTTSAAMSLKAFHKEFADHSAIPILIDEEYLVPLDENIRLRGRIDLILKNKQHYSVISLSGKRRRTNVSSLDLHFSALRLAFEHREASTSNVEYKFYDLGSDKTGFVNIEQPTQENVNALKYWAHNAYTKDKYVPRRGYTTYCRGCPFDAECKSFNDWSL